jgi:anthranilate synthase component 1
MYHLKFGDKVVVGSSPEMLVEVQNGVISTYPIAGTRPVGVNENERKAYRKELISDEKELAEHNMLVDLARNDVGRVSKFGSVQVPEYLTVKRFSHVQHIVSKVEGRLQNDKTALDALSAIFPAGTVSGAPKVRAMEIIDELEVSRRGPYAGAIGYFSLNGNLDSCIAIRTVFAENHNIYLQAGAGIVADSVGAKEWDETDHKLQALKKALMTECRQ